MQHIYADLSTCVGISNIAMISIGSVEPAELPGNIEYFVGRAADTARIIQYSSFRNVSDLGKFYITRIITQLPCNLQKKRPATAGLSGKIVLAGSGRQPQPSRPKAVGPAFDHLDNAHCTTNKHGTQRVHGSSERTCRQLAAFFMPTAPYRPRSETARGRLRFAPAPRCPDVMAGGYGYTSGPCVRGG